MAMCWVSRYFFKAERSVRLWKVNRINYLSTDESNLQEPERYVFGHHVDYDSLLRSKQLGCVSCQEFGYDNDRDDVNPTFEKLGYYSVFCIDLSQPTLLVYSGDLIEEFFHEMVAHDGKRPRNIA